MDTTPYKIQHWTSAQADLHYKEQEPHVVTVNDRAATREAINKTIADENVEFITRSNWNALKSRSPMTSHWNYSKIAIHHAGRSHVCALGADSMRKIQRDHQAKEYGQDIGYHYGIDCFGTIFEGRDIRLKGESVLNYNTGVIGIVLLENLSESYESSFPGDVALSVLHATGIRSPIAIPEIQKKSARVVISSLRQFFRIAELGGHREFPHQSGNEGKMCPGIHGINFCKELREWANLPAPKIQ